MPLIEPICVQVINLNLGKVQLNTFIPKFTVQFGFHYILAGRRPVGRPRKRELEYVYFLKKTNVYNECNFNA
jgi:hypothetical protein